MSFYLWCSLAVLAIVAYDLYNGRIAWSSWIPFMKADAIRHVDPNHFWIFIARRVAGALALAALAYFHVPETGHEIWLHTSNF
jgi:hypothetical protein